MPDSGTPFGFDPDEDEDTPNENKSFKELRTAYNRLSKEQKAAAQELDDLRAFKLEASARERQAQTESAFTQAGLNPKHSKLFAALNPEGDVTSERVASFVLEYGLVAGDGVAGGGEGAPSDDADSQPAPSGFHPVTTGNPPPPSFVSGDDITKWLASGDIESVNKAFEAGRVEKEAVPWTVVDS